MPRFMIIESSTADGLTSCDSPPYRRTQVQDMQDTTCDLADVLAASLHGYDTINPDAESVLVSPH